MDSGRIAGDNAASSFRPPALKMLGGFDSHDPQKIPPETGNAEHTIVHRLRADRTYHNAHIAHLQAGAEADPGGIAATHRRMINKCTIANGLYISFQFQGLPVEGIGLAA